MKLSIKSDRTGEVSQQIIMEFPEARLSAVHDTKDADSVTFEDHENNILFSVPTNLLSSLVLGLKLMDGEIKEKSKWQKQFDANKKEEGEEGEEGDLCENCGERHPDQTNFLDSLPTELKERFDGIMEKLGIKVRVGVVKED